MEMLKKLWKIALRVITGLLILLAVVLAVNEFFGDNDDEYYDVKNLKDYKSVSIKNAPDSFMKILAEIPKNETIDDGLQMLNLANGLDFENNMEKSKNNLKDMYVIGTRYANKIPNTFAHINVDFLPKDSKGLEEAEKNYKWQAKVFFGSLVKNVYEERMEPYKSLVEGDQFLAEMNQIGLSELFVEKEYNADGYKWFRLASIFDIQSCEPVKLSRANYLYVNLNNEPVKVKFGKGLQVTGAIDSMNRFYQIRRDYFDDFRINSNDLKKAADIEPESAEAERFINDLTKKYIMNGNGWKNKIVNDFVMRKIFMPEDILKLQASLNSIQESNIINDTNTVYIDLGYRIVEISFMPFHNLVMPVVPFDRDVVISCLVDVYEVEHFYLNNAYEVYIDRMRDKDLQSGMVEASNLKMIKL